MTTRDADISPNWATAAIRALPVYRRPATFADHPDPATRPRPIHLNESPYPPSGGMMGADSLRAVAKGVPDDVLLLVDEAYYEFVRHAGGPDALAILRDRKGPWLSTRTFSKAYALAALRIGYAICGDDTVAEALRRARLQFDVPTPTLDRLADALRAL